MADNQLTVKKIEGGSLDLDTLAKFVGGDENTVNHPRLRPDLDVGSIAELRKKIKDQLAAVPAGHKGYATLADAQVAQSSLAANTIVEVSNDPTTSNNGLYLWNGTILIKSIYDPLTQAKSYTDTVNQTSKDNSNDIAQVIDADTAIVARIKNDGHLMLVDLDDSVQNEITKAKSNINMSSNIGDMTHVFADSDGNIVMGIDDNGGLCLVGSTVTLQEKLNWRSVSLPPRQLQPRDMFADSVNKYILNMSVSGNQNAPMPFNLLPQKHAINSDFINAYELAVPQNRLKIDTPYGTDDKVVHPYVIEFSGNFRGYRYLMCITPYTQEYHENPTIHGSHDGNNWEMLTGFTQPIASPMTGRFLSDNGFCYDPINGMLVCYYREGVSNSADDTSIRYRATRDGIDWAEETLLIAADATSEHLSPSVLFNPADGLWHMWIGESVGIWRHYTASHLNNAWTLKSTITNMYNNWHCEVKFVGDKYVMLINKRDPSSNYYFAVSTDGDNWSMGNNLFATQQSALYKASFLPIFNGTGQIAFDVWYTTNHASDPALARRLYRTQTNFANLGV